MDILNLSPGKNMKNKKKTGSIYDPSFNKAADLLRNSDPVYISGICGTIITESGILVHYFDKKYTVKLPEVSFDPPDLSIYEQILVLHYLTTMGDNASKGEFISFKNLPGAFFYDPTYKKRGPGQILSKFGENIDQLVEAGQRLGGEKAEFGDISVKLPVFPKIEAVVVLYRGDEEFTPEANILFKDDIINYLPLEDIAVLSGVIGSRLKKALNKPRNDNY
jgi:hypothetical protein